MSSNTQCPFPGMDPYLEDPALWPKFHRRLVACVHHAVLPGLAERYDAAIGQRRYQTAASEGGAEHVEDFLEIRTRGDGKLVTLLEIVSPANKTTDAGRRAYLEKRQESTAAGASLVEIDLVLQGQPTLDYSRDGLPPWNYAVTVTRASQPDRYEIYTTTLQKRLPRFRLPLAGDDRDTVFDLQAVFMRAYAAGGYAARVDYGKAPPAALNEEDRRWLDAMLTAQGFRSLPPPHEEIARTAYQLWEQEGRPHGRDKEYWYRALERLRGTPPT